MSTELRSPDIAMDIKGPLKKYQKITSSNIDIKKKEKSASMIKKTKIDKLGSGKISEQKN